jgi:hypothetical protein
MIKLAELGGWPGCALPRVRQASHLAKSTQVPSAHSATASVYQKACSARTLPGLSPGPVKVT